MARCNNAAITKHLECGKTSAAFTLFEETQRDVSIHLTSRTLIALLKACIKLKDLRKGLAIHTEIARIESSDRDPFLGSTLVNMYAKCGSLEKAKDVFDQLPSHNEVSWNVLLSGYVEHGLADEALELYDRMQCQGISPSVVTFLSAVKACSSSGHGYRGLELHHEIERRGFVEKHPSVGSALIEMYAKCGWLAKAEEVFARLPAQNVVSWTSLIAGYAEHDCGEEALDCFTQMQSKGISPDAITLIWGLKACGNSRAVGKCGEIHTEIERRGLLRGNHIIGSTLVDVYAKCGLIARAHEVFGRLTVQNIASWNSLISGYAEHGCSEEVLDCLGKMGLQGVSPDAVSFLCALKACGNIGNSDKGGELHAEIDRKGLLEADVHLGSILVDMYARCGLITRAQEVFDKLTVRDVVSWNALITGYAECGHYEDAIACFEQMQAQGLSPDTATFVCMLKACGNVGATDKGHEMHCEIDRQGLLERHVAVGNTLIDMYVKWGWLIIAQQVFDKLPHRDIVSWNSLIAGYAQLGENKMLSNVFTQMLIQEVLPDPVTFLIVLAACNRTCLLSKSLMYFQAMSQDYGIIPTDEHHACVVDLLGRTGRLDKVADVVRKMSVCHNASLWYSVLGSCKNWGNVKLGEQAFTHTLCVDGEDTSADMLMSLHA